MSMLKRESTTSKSKSRSITFRGGHDDRSWLEFGVLSKADMEERDALLYRCHNYQEDITNDLMEPILILPEPGFRTEIGGNGDMDMILDLEDDFNHSPYYRDNFSEFVHVNYVGGNETNPYVVCAKMDENVQKDKKKGYLWKIMLWTKKESFLISLWAPGKQKMLKRLILDTEFLTDVDFIEVKDINMVDEIVHMEERLLVTAYRMGVLYCKEGQTDENEIFGNDDPSPNFIEFLNSIGGKIELNGFTGYKGGLDVKEDTTGTHSYYTSFRNFDIMFHVSTCLPYMATDEQSVGRKRHIGNDVVVIIFQDGPNGGFVPSSIKSKFNHIYAVVQPVEPGVTGPNTKYFFSLTSKDGVRIHGPVLPEQPVIFDKGPEFREFLLTKLINAERASYGAPGFAQARTRRMWLKNFLDKYKAD